MFFFSLKIEFRYCFSRLRFIDSVDAMWCDEMRTDWFLWIHNWRWFFFDEFLDVKNEIDHLYGFARIKYTLTMATTKFNSLHCPLPSVSTYTVEVLCTHELRNEIYEVGHDERLWWWWDDESGVLWQMTNESTTIIVVFRFASRLCVCSVYEWVNVSLLSSGSYA